MAELDDRFAAAQLRIKPVTGLGNDEPALRVLVDDPALRTARLALVEVVRHALEQGLGILGLHAPERM